MKFKWAVEIEVDKVWVEDGFNLVSLELASIDTTQPTLLLKTT
jgi:hypothetical protein